MLPDFEAALYGWALKWKLLGILSPSCHPLISNKSPPFTEHRAEKGCSAPRGNGYTDRLPANPTQGEWRAAASANRDTRTGLPVSVHARTRTTWKRSRVQKAETQLLWCSRRRWRLLIQCDCIMSSVLTTWGACTHKHTHTLACTVWAYVRHKQTSLIVIIRPPIQELIAIKWSHSQSAEGTANYFKCIYFFLQDRFSLCYSKPTCIVKMCWVTR